MKPIIIDMEEMSDSSELYYSRPHSFVIYSIYFMLGILLAAFMWMYFNRIDTVVRAEGLFCSSEKAVDVCTERAGRVTECNIEEGKYVDRGEILLIIQNAEKQEEYVIKADKSGIISMNMDINIGAYVKEGTNICSIFPEEEGEVYAEVAVGNKDIGKLKEGQKVNFEVEAYPSSEYGYFAGVVENISRDVKTESGTGRTYYLVKVSCGRNYLTDKNGNEGKIMNGMSCEAKIVTDKKRVLNYLFEKLGFF